MWKTTAIRSAVATAAILMLAAVFGAVLSGCKPLVLQLSQANRSAIAAQNGKIGVRATVLRNRVSPLRIESAWIENSCLECKIEDGAAYPIPGHGKIHLYYCWTRNPELKSIDRHSEILFFFGTNGTFGGIFVSNSFFSCDFPVPLPPRPIRVPGWRETPWDPRQVETQKDDTLPFSPFPLEFHAIKAK